MLQRQVKIAQGGLEQGDADAGADVVGGVLQRQRLGQGALHGLGHALGLRRGVGGSVAQAGEQYRKAVAASACQHFTALGGGAQALGHGLQNLVAHLVAAGVVDVLKAVQIQRQQCQRGGAGQRLLQAFAQQAAVGQLRQGS